jgi:hypothetical protein
VFKKVLVCLSLVLFIYTSASLTSPESGENFSFFAVQSVCSNLESSVCIQTQSGQYYVDSYVKNGQFVGELSRVSSNNLQRKVLADSFESDRMGSVIYKFNGFIIGSNYSVGIQNLMLLKSLIASIFLLITAIILPKELQKAFILTLLLALMISENIMHLGSIAPIGHSKIFYLMALVLIYSVLNFRLSKLREAISWVLICFYSFYLGLNRTDQALSFAYIAASMNIIYLLVMKFRKHQVGSKLSLENYSRSLLLLGVTVISFLTTQLQDESRKTIDSLTMLGARNGIGAGTVFWNILAQPYYLILDLAPMFLSINSPKITLVQALTTTVILFLVIYYCRLVVWNLQTIFDLVPIFCAYVLFVSYGAVIGPRVEIRYIMAPLLFGFFLIVSNSLKVNFFLSKKIVIGLIFVLFVLYLGVFLPRILKFEKSYLFGTIFISEIAAAIWVITLISNLAVAYRFSVKASIPASKG